MSRPASAARQGYETRPLDELPRHEVLVHVADRVATLTLNRPERLNAFTAAMAGELTLAFNSVAALDEVRAIVITGAGRAFCAGADLDELRRIHEQHDRAAGEALVDAPADLYASMHTARQPVLCALNGAAAGGGANLALACDLRIAGQGAAIGQVFAKLGLAPDWGGSWFLPRLVGQARALELFLSGEMVKGERLLQLGLVNRLVPDDQLAQAAQAWARELAATPPLSVEQIKALVYEGAGLPLVEMLSRELSAQLTLFESDDFAEGLRAFAEKRQPRFTGR